MSIYSFDSDFTDFVNIDCNISNETCTFLVDSQADISVIKLSSLTNDFYYDTSEIIRIKGVTNGTISSLGTVMVDLHIENTTIEHKFHLVPDEMAIPTDGIIGKDFIRHNRCCLDYDSMLLLIRLMHCELSIPIISELNDGSSIIPARSEVFRLFRINDSNFPRLIETREISPNIIIPNTIAYSQRTWVRVLNTSDENKVIRTDNLKSKPIDEFDIYLPPCTKSLRDENLMKLLAKKIPKYAPLQLIDLCMKFSHIFAVSGDDASVNNFYEQKLNFADETPVYIKNYRLPQSQKSEINSQVQSLLAKDLIELSTSSFNSPLILVPKKSNDGSKRWRMCVDYRMLNKKLVPDKFPLPRIEEILDSLGRAKYFSVMDLHSGFHQIPLEKNSRPATAFSTDSGFYQWKVLPFGLSIAPSSFSRMMSLAFAGLKPEQAFIYMDDLIVIGFSEKNHIQNLESVFKICEKYNLKLNPEKCDFFKPEVTFLGHTCTDRGLLPDKRKIEAVERYPIPHDKEATKRFVAFANYYRRFIPNFAAITQPLNKLTRKRVEFNWTSECENSFNTLKKILLSPQILQFPDFTKPFTVTVDASNFACGAVLSQSFDGEDLPICYISKSFKKGELNKPIIEKELLAIHFAITTFRPYLYGRTFTVKSDHKPLIFLYNLKNPASKLTRVRLELEEYDFVVEYIKGKDNVAADALSRISIKDLKEIYVADDCSILAITRSMARKANVDSVTQKFEDVINIESVNLIEELSSRFDKNIPRMKTTAINARSNELASIQLGAYIKHKKIFEIKNENSVNEKLTLKTIFSKLQKAAESNNIRKLQWPLNDKIFEMCNIEEFKYACRNDLNNLQIILCRPPKTISNPEEKLRILEQFHDDPLYGGHCGQKKLYAKIRSNFYWKGLTRDIAKYVKNCMKCQLNKPKRKNKEPMFITPTPCKPFDVIIVDTIGPLPTSHSGNQYAVTMMCDLTKYLISVPVPNKTATEVARAIFEKFILIYGPMKELRSDMGTEYRNELVAELCKMMSIKQRTSTAHHHQTVGTIERNHRVFNEYLRAYLTEDLDSWDTYLNYFTFCYNISKNSCFEDEYSPYELVYCRNINMPHDLLTGRVAPLYNIENYAKVAKFMLQSVHERAAKLLQKMKLRNKFHYDKQINPLKINGGDKVLLEIQPYNKHTAKYGGPFTVVNEDGSNVIIEDKNRKQFTVHKDRIRKFND